MKKFYFILLFLIFQPALSGSVLAQEPTIDRQYTLVNTERVNRVEFDFTYQVTVNNGDTAIQNVSATVSSTSANTVIIDNNVSFNNIALAVNETLASLDTFTLRQNRRYPFDPLALSWVIAFDPIQTPPVILERPLNDTGITWSGNYPSGNNANCTGETIGEQDCSHGRDALATAGQLPKVGGGDVGFDFTKLDANGNALTDQAQDYITQPWSCVKDNHTGLIWEVKTPDTQGTNLHSMHDSFHWYNTDPATNGGAVGFAGDGVVVYIHVGDSRNVCTGYIYGDASTRCNTQDFVARVNATGLCGATDWQLPNRKELRTIVHLGKSAPSIDKNYFPNNDSRFYWSSSPRAGNSVSAWGVFFWSGNDYGSNRNSNYQVRLVRVGQ